MNTCYVVTDSASVGDHIYGVLMGADSLESFTEGFKEIISRTFNEGELIYKNIDQRFYDLKTFDQCDTIEVHCKLEDISNPLYFTIKRVAVTTASAEESITEHVAQGLPTSDMPIQFHVMPIDVYGNPFESLPEGERCYKDQLVDTVIRLNALLREGGTIEVNVI